MKRRKRSRRCYLKSCARLTKIWSNTSQMSDTRMQILRRPGVNFAQVWSEFCAGWSEFCAGSGEFCAGLGEFGADSKSFLAIIDAVTPAIGKTPLPVGLSASTIVAINGSRYRLPRAPVAASTTNPPSTTTSKLQSEFGWVFGKVEVARSKLGCGRTRAPTFGSSRALPLWSPCVLQPKRASKLAPGSPSSCDRELWSSVGGPWKKWHIE